MIKLFVELSDDLNISNISTVKQGSTCLEAYLKEPVIHFDKFIGYELNYSPDEETKPLLVFNEEKYANYIKQQQKEQAIKDGETLLDSLTEKTILAKASDAEAYIMRYKYPEYAVGVVYSKGDRFMCQDKFYKVIMSEPFTSSDEWKPDISPSLYVEIPDPNVEYPEFKQPINAETAYMKGDKITYKNDKYVSKIDNNVYSPEAYPDAWDNVVV